MIKEWIKELLKEARATLNVISLIVIVACLGRLSFDRWTRVMEASEVRVVIDNWATMIVLLIASIVYLATKKKKGNGSRL